jgi:F-type H+-transporting ATPase subunit delta
MAELSTVARPYAEALFAVAQSGDLAKTQSELAALVALADNADVKAWVKTPQASHQQVLEVLNTAATAANQSSPLSATVSNFLATLVQNKRISLLPEIAKQFAVLKNTAEGAKDVKIISAFALSDAQLTDLTANLQKKFGTRLNPSVVIDAALIGGVRIKVGDQVLDTSVQAQLEQMRIALMA